MKVKIIKSTGLNYWYAPFINKIFEVEEYITSPMGYVLIQDPAKHIQIQDCIKVYDIPYKKIIKRIINDI